jgi:hypothetical protein
MSLFGGLSDSLFGGGSEASNEAVNQYNGLTAPSIEEQRLKLQKYVDAGQLTPEQAQAALVNSNAYDSMNLDTAGKDAQLEALGQLQDIGSNGGLDAQDRAKLQAIQNDEQTQSKGARDAIIQNAQARGVGGSGLEMLAQLTNAQDSATRASQKDVNVAAEGQQRALQAIQDSANLGGTINNNQFAQQKAVADSRNAINQFNAANTQQANFANAAANNTAQASNLANKQFVSNSNVGLANDQQKFNKGLAQTNFNNQLSIDNAKANALNKAATQANTSAGQDQNIVSGLGSVAGKIYDKLPSVFSDERVKKDIEHFNAGHFLDSLTGYKYKYKDPGMGEGKQVGIMAQDLEKEVPQMVEDTPHGKMVDYSPEKTTGPVLASLADLHERLRRLEGK